MKLKLFLLVPIFTFLLAITTTSAQAPPPPPANASSGGTGPVGSGPTGAPLDGGAVILLALSGIFALYKAKK